MMSPNGLLHGLIKKGGLVLGILFLASVMDSVVCNFIDGKHLVRALSGTCRPISGDLDNPVRRLEDVRYHFSDPGPALTIAQVRGRFWRGDVAVPPGLGDGIYSLHVSSDSSANPAGGSVYRVMVFASPASMNASYPSLTRRVLGISPWWITAVSGPLLAACLAIAFFLPENSSRLVPWNDIAPIVKLARHNDHWEVAGTLPAGYTTARGSEVGVTDKALQPITRMTVIQVKDGLVFGQINLETPVQPNGFIIFS